MAKMQAVYFRKTDGTEPVNEFIEKLSPKDQASLDLQIDRLNMLSPKDPPLPFPHSSQVKGELRELRCHYGNTLYRVFYQRSDRLFVLLHIIRKNSQKLPEADIEIAQKRMSEFRQRMNEKPRRPPRAAGRDAP
jgi:phage-related protein